jgi:hypothetical protein
MTVQTQSDAGRAPGPAQSPLILTLALDAVSAARFDAERRRYFPPQLNRIPAHVTMFHHLPGGAEAEIVEDLRAACARHEPEAIRVTGLLPLGRGVSYRLDAPGVATLRSNLARRWEPWLTPQDRQPWRPHVTVQNKVTPAEARDTLAQLQAAFEPFGARADGLLLWRYMGGPWDALGRFPFAGAG